MLDAKLIQTQLVAGNYLYITNEGVAETTGGLIQNNQEKVSPQGHRT